jgi:phenylpropionate dioxygenase-like ring-hydroxylating dioxygenase large terminal subunit
MVSRERNTLPGRDYHAAEVFDLERERIFARNWFYAGRAEGLDAPGDFVTVDVAGESVIVLRTKAGELRGFYNVCRHRGSRLCDEAAGRMKGAVKCPYHAWSYSFEGRLIGTPNVARDEVDRDALGLWPVPVDTWQGFLFVHLDPDPAPLEDALREQQDSPLPFARFNLGELRIGRRTVTEVQANWKILIENYNECLHCPTVHPELVAVVPAFRKGGVYDPARTDGGVALADGGNSFTRTGRSDLPALPGLDAHDESSLYGSTVYPNMFIDVTGTGAVSTILLPRDAGHTTVVTEYLFRPEVIAAAGFDPTDVVEFTELVAHQDYVVCERVQRGVRSRAFTRGVLAEKDSLLEGFNARYLAERGPAE